MWKSALKVKVKLKRGSGTDIRHTDDVPDSGETAALKPDQSTARCQKQASKPASEPTACQKGFLTIKVRGVAYDNAYPAMTRFGSRSIVANMVATYVSKKKKPFFERDETIISSCRSTSAVLMSLVASLKGRPLRLLTRTHDCWFQALSL